jgi:cobalt/nickel transport system permease protein
VHIPDGMLDTRTVGATWLAAVPTLGFAVRKVRARLSDGRLVLMAVLAGLIFALQMLNFPVAGGTSGHFAGGALAAILLGPWAAVLVLTSVLVVQAFIFSDGGVTALAANVVNMAIIAPLVGWWVYSLALRFSDTKAGRTAGAFIGAWSATMAAALSAAIMIWLSGAAPLAPVVGAMAFWHTLIGVGEGLVTAGLVAYVFAVRPDIMKADAEVLRPRSIAVSFSVMAALAAGLSFLASRSPDGLLTVAHGLGFLGKTAPASVGPLAGYLVPGVANQTVAGALAGLVGVVVTGVLLYALLKAPGLRRSPAPPDDANVESPAGVHTHVHTHDGEVHEHVHHHASERHEHGHGSKATRIAAQVSPLHRLDPRAKIVAAVVLIVGVVLAPPMRPLEFGLLVALLVAAAVIGRLPLLWVLRRSAMVLPVAGTIALFAPLARSGGSFSVAGIVGAWSGGGWVVAWAIVSKAWVSVVVTVLLSGTTPTPQLIRGLEALKVPDVFVTLFSFVYRYVDVFRAQVRSMRVALDSRAPSMSRPRRWRLYGNLAGNLFVRAYDRGSRIHDAMLSRGFDGTLPTTERSAVSTAELLLVAVALLAAAAIALY